MYLKTLYFIFKNRHILYKILLIIKLYSHYRKIKCKYEIVCKEVADWIFVEKI